MLIKSTAERVDGLLREVADLKASLEYSQKDIATNEEAVGKNELTIATNLNNMKILWINATTKLRTLYLENQSRRNNIRRFVSLVFTEFG